MQNDIYAPLEKIIDETIKTAMVTGNINLMEFRQKTEQEFINIGFRSHKTARGGVENILILRLDHVGDFILTTPAIRELRMNYPFARITLVVSQNNYKMAELCPYVNEVLVFDTNFATENILEIIRRVSDFANKYLWQRRYKLGINFRYTDELKNLGTFMLYISGCIFRVGYTVGAYVQYLNQPVPSEGNISNFLLTHSILNPKEILHDCMWSLYLLQVIGLKIHHTDLEIWCDSTDFYKAEKLLEYFAPNKIKIAVGLGGGWAARKYPVEKYLIALKKIIDKGAAVMILGGPSESNNAKFLQDNLPKDAVINFAAIRPGWRVDAAAISQMNMYIGNDTGTQHIAAAFHLPIILLSREGIFPNSDVIPMVNEHTVYFPWQTNTIILRPKNVNDISTINPIEIVEAYDKFVDFIKNSGVTKINCPPIIRSMKQNLHSGFVPALQIY